MPPPPLYTSSSLLFLFHPSGFPHIRLSVLRTSPCNASDAAMSSEHNESGCRAPPAARYLSHPPPPTPLQLQPQPQRASPLHLPSHLPLPSVRTAVQHASCRRLTLNKCLFGWACRNKPHLDTLCDGARVWLCFCSFRVVLFVCFTCVLPFFFFRPSEKARSLCHKYPICKNTSMTMVRPYKTI